MEIKTFIQGALQTNSYILVKDNYGIFIDPQGNPNTFLEYLSENNINPIAILLTHGHFDHIGAAEYLRESLNIPIYASLKEKELLANPNLNLSPMMNQNIKLENCEWIDYPTLELESFKITVIETPGHTTGSVCYVIDDIIISGDTLFKNSYGRFDFPTGNLTQLKESLQKLFHLEGNYTVYPGHGESTTLEYERKFNPLR